MPRQVRTSMAGPAPSGADHTVAGGLQRCPDPQILSSGVSSQSFGVDFIEPVVASAFTGSSITVLLDTLNMHIMLDVKDTLLNRTSIRRYEREPIPAETMDFIYRAVANTPTSYNGQQFSVIDIDDQALKETLYGLTNQKQLKTCNRLLIFCSDYNKISLLAAKKNLKMPSFTDTMDGVTIGIIDASLAMMSAVVAAESCGLGTNCIGYLRTVDPARVAELLHLPKGVFVVCGLALGVPREHPDLKPKQPASLVFHRNAYRQDNEKMVAELEKYDETVQTYNRTRSGSTTDNDWVAHIIGYYDHAMTYRILDYLRDQGYDVKR